MVSQPENEIESGKFHLDIRERAKGYRALEAREEMARYMVESRRERTNVLGGRSGIQTKKWAPGLDKRETRQGGGPGNENKPSWFPEPLRTVVSRV